MGDSGNDSAARWCQRCSGLWNALGLYFCIFLHGYKSVAAALDIAPMLKAGRRRRGKTGRLLQPCLSPLIRELDAFPESLRRLPHSNEWENLLERENSPKGSWEGVRKEKWLLGRRERETKKEREREKKEREFEVKYIKRHDLHFNVHPLSYNKTAVFQLYRNLITHIVHCSTLFIPAVLSKGRKRGVCHQDFLEVSRSFQFQVEFFFNFSFNLWTLCPS